ncbi:hypothetical protein CDAR_539161 [Caerostris darwini]|uniref:Transmembrane protein n=1 Tax=Caerostris darwini TaxID=1538125 RepID=A0AAV4T4C5_9ARAC|nr:hypothetical protein CDAR_539161 [Caerostris darwini]
MGHNRNEYSVRMNGGMSKRPFTNINVLFLPIESIRQKTISKAYLELPPNSLCSKGRKMTGTSKIPRPANATAQQILVKMFLIFMANSVSSLGTFLFFFSSEHQNP